ncbi:tail fiber assembly protein [Cupriavidus sp. USMAHM13]|uniref:tail fiber assembly protein n=1 Tax=Cupriavidus sp. USMAHM13 TaxID=1389192 RepID=UPI0009F7353C|nr:tail fiber assembly protein [Cupriavidus sp. USMAHM13]
MAMFYAPSTQGFYDSEINGGAIPKDAVEIDQSHYEALQAGQEDGKLIRAGADGAPCLADVPGPTAADLLYAAQVKRGQLMAEAALRIAPLQDAVDLGIATTAEVSALNAWKSFRVALNRLDLTVQPIVWPSQPQ